MPKQKNIIIDYTSRDFESIKQDLVDYAKRYYPDTYKDFTDASFGSMVLDSVSYVGDVLSYYLDYSVNESFLDTSIEIDNIRKHARALGYNYSGTPSSYGVLSFYILCPSNTEGTAPDYKFLPVLKRGSQFSGDNDVNFILTEDVDFNDPLNQIVSARFDESSGATTYFAIKAFGLVQSGTIFTTEVILDGTFEKFRKIRIGDIDITEIMSVVDSSGNDYFEVDNLAQEVIFLETSNPDAMKDGVRSILKPHIATRRFVLQRDDTGTYIQFGFGSEDEDSTGVVDPARIALRLHGKNHISNKSFDPSKLLSTDKLGISPFNTTLTITYRVNQFGNSSVGANSLRNVTNADLMFRDRSQLDGLEVSFITDSLEVTNEEPFSSLSDDITIEELKQRAISNYASQGRAVTKQDYESLVYNMPSKFGGIKRANIVNDPSSSNRKLALYIVSESPTETLFKTHTVVKNNLKNWLSRYKMLNDSIEIFDAKIVNFSIDFLAISDPRYDSDVILTECISDLQNYFAETLYIGEPLYLTRIYERLNNVKGVMDVKKVMIENKVGGNYSSVSMQFDEAMSRDGTYLKVPKNVILELKYPDLDIKGTIK
tara:strand:+ start:426 stop:2222 length:1797 start_codon:yes stop_codon:yes gene_type:complete